MIVPWTVYTLLVSGLVAVGARGIEELGRVLRVPLRFIWVAALLAMVLLGGLAPLRGGLHEGAAGVAVVEGAAASLEKAAQAAPAGPGLTVAVVASGLRRALALPLNAAAEWSDGIAGGAVGLVWLLLVVGFLALGITTLLRYGIARRRWPWREIAGIAVRVSPGAGPAVLGLLRPEIVVPAWLLDKTPAEQRLVVLHEREHLRARDGLVLTAGWLAAVLVPWNPVAWWMLARLRLAVELDCDARVLRRGVPPRAYGSMLIDLAGHEPGLSLGAPALAGSRSTLERRLFAMTTRISRTGWIRAAALGGLGALALIAACDARMPTAAEIEEMDVAEAEARAGELGLLTGDGGIVTDGVVPEGPSPTYFVDGVEVTAEEAHALPAERVERVGIRGGDGNAVIRIRSRSGAGPDAATTTVRGTNETLTLTPGSGFDGLLLIDGLVADRAALRDLRPSRIESIEVIKGPAATALYDDPAAANGVILVTTRDAAGA